MTATFHRMFLRLDKCRITLIFLHQRLSPYWQIMAHRRSGARAELANALSEYQHPVLPFA